MPDPAPPETLLCFAVYAAHHAFSAAYKPLLDPLGLTYPQYLVMLVLWDGPPPTVKGIGARLGLDSGTLTPLLKRLEAAGLVTRQRDARDERLVRIHLTPDGAALRVRAAAIPGQVACVLGEDHEALATLRDRLQALGARLRTT